MSPTLTPIVPVRLVDRDMFMRFRGGGVGHRYMRQVEPWLDATGWGASWPSFTHRIPEPAPTQQDSAHGQGDGNPATTQGSVGNSMEGGGSGGAGNAEEESEDDEDDEDDEGGNLWCLDGNGEGNDPEQPDEDEVLDEEGDDGEVGDGPTDPDEELDEDAEPFPSGFISL